LDPVDEKRLDRFEQKIDQISEKISAFPVVGQRIVDLERRVVSAENELREMRLEVGANTNSITKVLTWIGMAGAVLVLGFRELMRHFDG
jgi:hypothetical protein